MDKVCAVHGQQLPPTSCTNMDATRKTQVRQTQRDTEKTVEKKRRMMAFHSWVEVGLVAADRVCWMSTIFSLLLCMEWRT